MSEFLIMVGWFVLKWVFYINLFLFGVMFFWFVRFTAEHYANEFATRRKIALMKEELQLMKEAESLRRKSNPVNN